MGDEDDLIECERCPATTTTEDMQGWGVYGPRGFPGGQTCPECTTAVCLFVAAGKLRLEAERRHLRLVPDAPAAVG